MTHEDYIARLIEKAREFVDTVKGFLAG